MTSDDIINVGQFLEKLEKLEIEHGIHLLSKDRLVQLRAAKEGGGLGRDMGRVSLNGHRQHEWWT